MDQPDQSKPVVIPPEFPLVDARIDPQHAAVSQFLGILEETERKRAIKRTLSFWIPRDLDAAIDRIVHDSRCGYDHDIGRFILHAIYLLGDSYRALGYPDVSLGSELQHEYRLRHSAERARRRNAIVEALHQFDEELDYACRTGDWESVDAHLHTIERLLQEAPNKAAQQRVIGAVAQSATTQAAVMTLYRACQTQPSIPEETKHRAERWWQFFEDLPAKQG